MRSTKPTGFSADSDMWILAFFRGLPAAVSVQRSRGDDCHLCSNRRKAFEFALSCVQSLALELVQGVSRVRTSWGGGGDRWC